MAKATEITVQVNARLDVDEKTATTCMRLLEIFINKAGLLVLPFKNSDGEIELIFAEEPTSKICPLCGADCGGADNG